MGCTSSRHLEKRACMSRCPSPSRSTLTRDYAVEYYHRHHVVSLTSSLYNGELLKVASSKHAETSNPEKEAVPSLNDMYSNLKSLEMGLPLCDTLVPHSDTGISSSSAYGSCAHQWHIDSAHVVISKTVVNTRDLMRGFDKETPLQGPSPMMQTVAFPAQTPPNKKLEKSFHTVEEVDVFKNAHMLIQDAREEDDYDSGKENAMPGNGHHSAEHKSGVCTRSPLGDAPLRYSSTRNTRANERGSPSAIKSTTEQLISMSTSQAMAYATSSNPNICSQQHRKKSSPSFAPLSISSRSMSRRVFMGGNILSTEPSSPLFDPDLVYAYEKALNSISEDNWNACLVDSPDMHRHHEMTPAAPCVGHNTDVLSCLGKLISLKRELYDPFQCFEERCPPGGDKNLVLYTTTLRGIRKTYEDCNTVRSIFQSFGVIIDERDVSMHLEFLNELRGLMGRVVSVPRVFIKGRYIGDIEDITKLHEHGKLQDLMEGLQREVKGSVCDGCGGVRFVPCLECSESCKVRREDNKITRCPDCNENGLIQCPICT